MLRLASRAVAQLAIQRLFATQLVLNLAAVACSLVASLEVVVLIVHLVRRAELPVVQTLLALLVDLVRIHAAGESADGSC